MSKLRVLVVDDHELVRSGICALLRELDGVEVAGEAGTRALALTLAVELRPDLVFMDVALGGDDGIALVKELAGRLPDTRFIVLSMHRGDDLVRHAFRAGASGYVLKQSAADELGHAIRNVRAGKRYVSLELSQHIVDNFLHEPDGVEAVPSMLSARQLEILKLLAQGESVKEIAHRFGLSPKTVEAHRAQIMERLGVRDVVGLVHYAIRFNLISIDR